MTPRALWHHVRTPLILATTIPLLALLCRGHTPSHYALANLPVWERQLPKPVPTVGHYRLRPFDPNTVQDRTDVPVSQLLAANEDRLFRPSGTAKTAPVGSWLTAASALCASSRQLAAKRDRVAFRLMDLQDADGSLLTKPAKTEVWTPAQVSEDCDNLAGMIAYYQRTKNPAAISTAMRAGDQLATKYSHADIPVDPEITRDLTLPLTQLHQLTGEGRYLSLAVKIQKQGVASGLGWCALYEATGDPASLAHAEHEWHHLQRLHQQPTPELTAELLKLTGNGDYAAALTAAPPSSVWPGTVLYTRTPQGIALNGIRDSRFRWGSLILTQYRDVPDTKMVLSLATLQPAKWTLHLFVPAQFPETPSSQSTSPQIAINGTALSAKLQPDRYCDITRRWKSGDTLVLKYVPRPIPTLLPVGHTAPVQKLGDMDRLHGQTALLHLPGNIHQTAHIRPD